MINIFNNIIYYMNPFSKNKESFQQFMISNVKSHNNPKRNENLGLPVPKPKHTKPI